MSHSTNHRPQSSGDSLETLVALLAKEESLVTRAQLNLSLAIRYEEVGEGERAAHHLLAFRDLTRALPSSEFPVWLTPQVHHSDPQDHAASQRLLRHAPTLTPTETQISILLARNSTSKEIARRLGISPTTVDLHRSRIRKKLGLDHSMNLTTYLTTLL